MSNDHGTRNFGGSGSGGGRAWTRREFVSRGLVLASAAASLPAFLNRSALAMPSPAGSNPGVPDDHVLVVVQLSGGNDGLNTVVPYGFDAYHRARPGIGVREDQALHLGRGAEEAVGLHPSMTGIKEMFDEGLVSIVQGVGYPNPDRSHFKSMDIWHTADTSGTGTGWLGRYIDSECCGFGKGESGRADAAAAARRTPMDPPITIGRTAPLALQGGQMQPVSFETADLFRWTGEDIHPALAAPYQALMNREPGTGMAPESNASFLMRTTLDAQVSSDKIRKAVALRSLVEYPRSELGQQLSMIANMIRAGLKTRVFYATLGGFDTHSQQGGANGRHAQLMRTFSDAMRAFYADLTQQGNNERVLTLTFSEFGRRVGQNASGGTDHGTAAPVFLFGPMVEPGVRNRHPSLTDLDEGDLKYTTDFRSVYASILEHWMGADSRVVLEGTYKPAQVIKRA